MGTIHPYIPRDFATPERLSFINSVSPFLRPCERRAYIGHFLTSLLLGRPMPHEFRLQP